MPSAGVHKKSIRRKVEEAVRRREAGEDVYFKSPGSIGVSIGEVPPTYKSLRKLGQYGKAAWIDYLMGKFGFVPIGPTAAEVRSRKGIKDRHFVGTHIDRALNQLIFFEQRLHGCEGTRGFASFVDSIAEKVAAREKEVRRTFSKSGPRDPKKLRKPHVTKRRQRVKELALGQAAEPGFGQYDHGRLVRDYNFEQLAKELGIDAKTVRGKEEAQRRAIERVSHHLQELKKSKEIPLTTPQDKSRTAKRLRVIPDITHPEVQEHKKLAFSVLKNAVFWDRVPEDARRELMNVALEGVRLAVERYDDKKINPKTGKPYAFSTFAYPTIRGTILTHTNKVLGEPEKIRTVSMDEPISARDERTRHERIGTLGTQWSDAKYSEALDILMRLNHEGKLYARDIVVFVLAEVYDFSQSAIARSDYFSMSSERVRQILEKVEKVLEKNH